MADADSKEVGPPSLMAINLPPITNVGINTTESAVSNDFLTSKPARVPDRAALRKFPTRPFNSTNLEQLFKLAKKELEGRKPTSSIAPNLNATRKKRGLEPINDGPGSATCMQVDGDDQDSELWSLPKRTFLGRSSPLPPSFEDSNSFDLLKNVLEERASSQHGARPKLSQQEAAGPLDQPRTATPPPDDAAHHPTSAGTQLGHRSRPSRPPPIYLSNADFDNLINILKSVDKLDKNSYAC